MNNPVHRASLRPGRRRDRREANHGRRGVAAAAGFPPCPCGAFNTAFGSPAARHGGLAVSGMDPPGPMLLAKLPDWISCPQRPHLFEMKN